MLGLFKRKEKEISKLEKIEERLHDELGIDLLNVNPRVIAKYKFKVNSSKNCLLSDEQVIIVLSSIIAKSFMVWLCDVSFIEYTFIFIS